MRRNTRSLEIGQRLFSRTGFECLTEVDDELTDLETGDPFFPPDSDTPSTLKVVPIHNYVDHQVQADRDPRNRREANELSVA